MKLLLMTALSCICTACCCQTDEHLYRFGHVTEYINDDPETRRKSNEMNDVMYDEKNYQLASE